MTPPFPYFGGKARIAHVIWDRLGNPPLYIEPFIGSAATLLARPHQNPTGETINDADHYVANFWRAVSWGDKDGIAYWMDVAHYADWPINETDVRARRKYLKDQTPTYFKNWMVNDYEFFDVRIAGIFCWMMGLNIANGYGNSKPKSNPNGIHGLNFRERLYPTFQEFHQRLRWVRVLCDDWHRVLTPVETTGSGITGVYFDPPYADYGYVYGTQSIGVSHEVREWCIEHGDDPLFRIALSGYHGEHSMPDGWEMFNWKAGGGYGNQGEPSKAKENAELERIWFSPHCLHPMSLFDTQEDVA